MARLRLAAAMVEQLEQIRALLRGHLVAGPLGTAGEADGLELRDLRPCGTGLLDFAGLKVNLAEHDEAVGVVQLSRAQRQTKRVGGIPRHAIAREINHRRRRRRATAAERGGFFPNLQRLGNARCPRPRAEVALAKIRPRLGGLPGGRLKMAGDDFGPVRHVAFSEILEAHEVHCARVPLVGGAMPPAHGPGAVAFHPVAIAAAHRQRKLRGSIAGFGFGGEAVQLDGVISVGVHCDGEHGGKDGCADEFLAHGILNHRRSLFPHHDERRRCGRVKSEECGEDGRI